MHFINVSVVCTFFEALALFSRLVDSARNRGKQEKSSKSRCLLCSTLKPLISNMIGTLALSEPLFYVLVSCNQTAFFSLMIGRENLFFPSDHQRKKSGLVTRDYLCTGITIMSCVSPTRGSDNERFWVSCRLKGFMQFVFICSIF